MTLDITHDDDELLSGVFAFAVHGQQGSYNVAGRLGPKGRFIVFSKEWIERPAAFSAIGLSGVISSNDRLIESDMTGCPGSFKATREKLVTAVVGPAEPVPLATGNLRDCGKAQSGAGWAARARHRTIR